MQLFLQKNSNIINNIIYKLYFILYLSILHILVFENFKTMHKRSNTNKNAALS